METVETPKRVTIAALAGGLEEKIERMGSQKITVSDHMNKLPYTADESEDFVIDMESFPAKDAPPYSRVTKSLSRKWSYRSGDEKATPNANANANAIEKKNEKEPILPLPSPRGCVEGVKSVLDPESHHQITIPTPGSTTEGRFGRRNTFRRSSSFSSSWILDPKRILFVFASLSSIGTILLIYFTLSIGRTVVESE